MPSFNTIEKSKVIKIHIENRVLSLKKCLKSFHFNIVRPRSSEDTNLVVM